MSSRFSGDVRGQFDEVCRRYEARLAGFAGELESGRAVFGAR